MTVRSSTRGLPGLPRGRFGLSAFQASSDSQNQLFAMTITLQRLKSGANIQSKSINCMSSQPSLHPLEWSPPKERHDSWKPSTAAVLSTRRPTVRVRTH